MQFVARSFISVGMLHLFSTTSISNTRAAYALPPLIQVLIAQHVLCAMQLLMQAVSDALGIIFTESYLSLAALLSMFLMCFGFASAGGVGASASPAGSTVAKFAKDEDSIRSRLALR